MIVSSDPYDIFNLASSDNLIKIKESYANIQVNEGTLTTVEEVNKNVPQL